VSAGSAFAAAQSIGATGSLAILGTAGTVAVTGAVALITGAVAAVGVGTGYGIFRVVQWGYRRNVDNNDSIQSAKAIIKEITTNDLTGFELSNKLQQLVPHLVCLKRVWKELKEVLQARYIWEEPIFGDGTFKCLMDWNAFSPPNLDGLCELIDKICK